MSTGPWDIDAMWTPEQDETPKRKKRVPDNPVWVCVDCYYEHHGIAEEKRQDGRSLFDRWADEQLTDHTNSETGDGIHEFSKASCDGCESPLAGSRYRLNHWPKEEQ